MEYRSGLASLFATAARAGRWTFHYDVPNAQWNVFDGGGNYVLSKATAHEARAYCDEMNGKETSDGDEV